MAQPEKETTPLVSVPTQFESAAPEVPVPLVMASVTVELSVNTVFPFASSTVTIGCVAKATS
jgi:hypothetical protein